ncbi:helix-turn-helix transcriptional regulator [Pedobacter sp. MR2016-19]|uniref:helix-turn-helix domain-containing protein n=1 Tax=Pedobacter sp. MR2016-19 TaxID=2780089 RepID=UPI001874C73E|nr:AraC family transcriptional regulator [Pedobacter sp. MR2016-19]MBE5320348.1 helix-turn-helix transcriptional regulator [Pedobacter sp. MR2016-19]
MMAFEFNIYSAFLLLPFSQAVLFGILLICKTGDKFKISNLLLGIILLMIGIKIAFWMLGFAGWYDSHDTYTSFMFYFPFNTICLIGPLIYFYFLSATNQNFKFKKKHANHIWLPIIWAAVILGKLSIDYILYFPFPKNLYTQFGTKGPLAEIDKTMLFNLISYGSFVYYLLLTFKSFYAYKQYAVQNLSSLENLDFVWLRNILLALGTGLVLMFIYQLINWVTPLSYKADWYSYMFLGVLVYYLGIKGYMFQVATKPALYFTQRAKIDDDQSYEPKVFLDLPVRMSELTKLLDQQKPYLISELTLNQLASMMTLNSGILSRVINTGYNLNFNDFINGYRIKEVLSKIDDQEHKKITLLGIALDSGFNSKATFNRAFKKQMGKTPLEYIKSLEKP